MATLFFISPATGNTVACPVTHIDASKFAGEAAQRIEYEMGVVCWVIYA